MDTSNTLGVSSPPVTPRWDRLVTEKQIHTPLIPLYDCETYLWHGDNSLPGVGFRHANCVARMFVTHPGSKTYFSHLNISQRSPHLLSHGKKIVLAIAEGAINISQLTETLTSLQTLHAYKLRITPSNFKVLSHCIMVTLACYLGEDFTSVHHSAMDKYLSALSAVLMEKYR